MIYRLFESRTFFILFVLFLFVTSTQIHGQTWSDRLQGLEKTILSGIEENRWPGVEVLLAEKGQIEYHNVFGYKNISTKEPAPINGLYYIQSMTKPIVKVAIMQLIEKGKLKLEDRVSKYVPEIENLEVIMDLDAGINGATILVETPITVRHLLTHTSGLSHGLGENRLDKELYNHMYGPWTSPKKYDDLEDRIVNGLFEAPLIEQPGSQWYYSASPDVLALIVEKISGISFDVYLEKNIFEPLGMQDTTYQIQDTNRLMFLHYSSDGQSLVPMNLENSNLDDEIKVFGGTHGLYSSSKDYFRFSQMILNKGTLDGVRILEEETVASMIQNQVANLYDTSGSLGFGYGFEVVMEKDAEKTGMSLGSISWSGYFNTSFFIDYELEIVGIWMTQVLPSNIEMKSIFPTHVYESLK